MSILVIEPYHVSLASAISEKYNSITTYGVLYTSSNVVSIDHHTSHFDAIGPSFRLFPRFQPREVKIEWHYIVSIQLFQLLPSGSGFYNLHAF